MKRLKRLQNDGKWKKSTLLKILQQYERLEDGKKQEYVGVPIYLIQKYLKKMSAIIWNNGVSLSGNTT